MKRQIVTTMYNNTHKLTAKCAYVLLQFATALFHLFQNATRSCHCFGNSLCLLLQIKAFSCANVNKLYRSRYYRTTVLTKPITKKR